jgi:hypothetical protein
MQVDVSESGQGSCHAVQFILKPFSFFLELANYRLHQCLWHRAILSPTFGHQDGSYWLALFVLDGHELCVASLI